MKKNILSLSLKNVTILAGVCVILLSVSIYASSQNKKSYRSVNATTTVGFENDAGSFNANKIEEHGDCKIVTQNTCGKDVFIPTATSPERAAFKNNHPSCIVLADCANTCVLKEFMEWVYAGTTTHSKVRNAITWFVNNYGTGNERWPDPEDYYTTIDLYPDYINDNFIIGYGEDFAVSLATGYYNSQKIVSRDSLVAIGTASYSWINIYEFELYGITPETENTNRGCFDDGSYRVNSNISSKQTLKYDNTWILSWDFTTSRFWWIGGVNLWLKINGRNAWHDTMFQSYNKFFGCKSELLPNPDRYCVERVVPKQGTAQSKPSAIYVKEFTNNASFSYALCNGTGDACLTQRNSICTALTGIANSDFRALSTGDIDPMTINGTQLSYSSYLYNMIAPSWLSNNTGFIYRNSTGANYWSQIFWFYRYSSENFYPYNVMDTSIADTNEQYYWYNSQEMFSHSIKYTSYVWANAYDYQDAWLIIPLSNTDKFLILGEHLGVNGAVNYEIWAWWSGDIQGMYSATFTKYVCVSYTCNAWYHATSVWCVCDNPIGNDCLVGGIQIPGGNELPSGWEIQ